MRGRTPLVALLSFVVAALAVVTAVVFYGNSSGTGGTGSSRLLAQSAATPGGAGPQGAGPTRRPRRRRTPDR